MATAEQVSAGLGVQGRGEDEVDVPKHARGEGPPAPATLHHLLPDGGTCGLMTLPPRSVQRRSLHPADGHRAPWLPGGVQAQPAGF